MRKPKENPPRRMLKPFCIILFSILSCMMVRGEEVTDETLSPLRPLSSTYAVSIGSSSDLNTYLSPLKQTGTHIGLSGTWSRATAFNPERFVMDFDVAASMDFNHNKQKTSSMSGVDLSLAWDMLYRLKPLTGLQIAGGAGLELDAGALYLPRNSNNPVAARFSLDLTLNLRADYKLPFKKFPVIISDRFSLPSLGVFFSPQYGESYYEIYLGDNSGLAHCGWWGNHFAFTNTLMAQIPVCNIRLCMGYRAQCRSSYVNHINTRLVNHSFVLGISTDWINVTRPDLRSQRSIVNVY